MVAAAFQKPMEAKPDQLWLRIHSVARRIGKHLRVKQSVQRAERHRETSLSREDSNLEAQQQYLSYRAIPVATVSQNLCFMGIT